MLRKISLAALLVIATAVETSPALGSCAAIGYNDHTGAIGWSTSWSKLSSAKSAALARAKGGAIVTWVCGGGYVALAVGFGGWGVSGIESSVDRATKSAVNSCARVAKNCTWQQWVGGP